VRKCFGKLSFDRDRLLSEESILRMQQAIVCLVEANSIHFNESKSNFFCNKGIVCKERLNGRMKGRKEKGWDRVSVQRPG
jgi:hypothetical protein